MESLRAHIPGDPISIPSCATARPSWEPTMTRASAWSPTISAAPGTPPCFFEMPAVNSQCRRAQPGLCARTMERLGFQPEIITVASKPDWRFEEIAYGEALAVIDGGVSRPPPCCAPMTAIAVGRDGRSLPARSQALGARSRLPTARRRPVSTTPWSASWWASCSTPARPASPRTTCWCPRTSATALPRAARRCVNRLYPDLARNPDYTSIISPRHFGRLVSMIDAARAAGAGVVPLTDAPARRRRRACRPCC